MAAENLSISSDAALYIAHHVFLPPKLPGSNDFDGSHETLLMELLCKSLSEFKFHSAPQQRKAVAMSATMLHKMRQIHDAHGHLDESSFKIAYRELCKKGQSQHINAEMSRANDL